MSKIVSKSLKNVKIAFILFAINLVVTFIARKYFLQYLGPDILGVNTIISNLLGLLNLAELGIVSAISYALYKPITENDIEQINEILSVQAWLYQKVALFILLASSIVMIFFPIIFAKSKLPLWYAYGSFIVLLVGTLLSYVISFVQVLLIADLKEYKVNLSVKLSQITKTIFQVGLITYVQKPVYGFIAWMICELVFGVFVAYLVAWQVKKEYTWLNISVSEGKQLKTKHQEIITKIKQVFFHKFGALILSQTTPLIIYFYISLTVVTKYENYMLIIWGLTSLMAVIFSTLQPAIGNFIAKHSQDKVELVLQKYTIFRFWLVFIICFLFYHEVGHFIQLWIGKQYVLDNNVLISFCFLLFLYLARVIDAFLAGYGLFHDIYAPVIEAVLNITFSLVLGYFFGLSGIIYGVVLSLLIVVYFWKPYFLYSQRFKKSVIPYMIKVLFILLLLSLAVIISIYLINFIGIMPKIYSYFDFIIHAIYIGFVYIIVSFIILLFTKDFRIFVKNVKSLLDVT